MSDPALQSLLESSTNDISNPLEIPSSSVLTYLASLPLSEEDFELILGDAPGLSWSDLKKDTQILFFRLRQRVAGIVCNDKELKTSVGQAVTISAEAGWLALVGAFGLGAGTVVAAALKPIAVALVKQGVEQLCPKSRE